MEKKMKLSVQAIGALMMALQKCIAEQIDIVDILANMELVEGDDGLVVLNPPVVRVLSTEQTHECCGKCKAAASE